MTTKDGRKSMTDANWQGIKRGDALWHPDRGGPFRVMTVVDGYVLLRRPGCMPFVESVRDVGRKWLTADPVTPNVELTGSGQVHRPESSEQSERG